MRRINIGSTGFRGDLRSFFRNILFSFGIDIWLFSLLGNSERFLRFWGSCATNFLKGWFSISRGSVFVIWILRKWIREWFSSYSDLSGSVKYFQFSWVVQRILYRDLFNYFSYIGMIIFINIFYLLPCTNSIYVLVLFKTVAHLFPTHSVRILLLRNAFLWLC